MPRSCSDCRSHDPKCVACRAVASAYHRQRYHERMNGLRPPVASDSLCAQCGKVVSGGGASLPPGKRTCRECRRGDYPPGTRRGVLLPLVCVHCGKEFERHVRAHVARNHGPQWYCSRKCVALDAPDYDGGETAAKWRAWKKSHQYGYDHVLLRRELLAELQDGDPCARCGESMFRTQTLHLDHTDDRTGYLGLSHAECNIRAASRLGIARQMSATCGRCGGAMWPTQQTCSICRMMDIRARLEARERIEWPEGWPQDRRKLRTSVYYYTCRYCGVLKVDRKKRGNQREVCPAVACQQRRLAANSAR